VSNTRVIPLSFDDDCSETVEVTEVAPGQFRLHWTPVTADPPVYLGDLIEAQPGKEGVYRFQHVIKRSGFRVYERMLARKIAESPELAEFAAAIERLGGHVERILGGCFIVHLPADAPFDVEQELEAVIDNVSPDT
jgi:hypothetical protein